GNRKSRCFHVRDPQSGTGPGRRFPRGECREKADGEEEPTASSRRDWEWRRGRCWRPCCPHGRNQCLERVQRSPTRSAPSGTNPPTSQGQFGVRLAKVPCKS